MSETERETRPGFWHRVGRRLQNAWDAVWILDGLITIGRLLLIPFRLLGRALSSL
ncbi:hypothetical protein [Actinotalea sp. C106]|uniref:hypothetical protein n=1 Tax=Actinotalea sp. C106 TaxID=2908644 RepID=UPI002028227A|nr:hypothetical protein [Actinotalea sp. C106]